MNDDDIRKFDQSSAFIGDSLPPLWHRMYAGCLAAGFNEEQALALVIAYVFAAAGGKYKA